MAFIPAPPTVNGNDSDADKVHRHHRGDSDAEQDENDDDGDDDDGGNDNDDDDDNGNDNDDDRKDIIATDSRPDDYSDPVVVAVADSSILLLSTRLIFYASNGTVLFVPQPSIRPDPVVVPSSSSDSAILLSRNYLYFFLTFSSFLIPRDRCPN